MNKLFFGIFLVLIVAVGCTSVSNILIDTITDEDIIVEQETFVNYIDGGEIESGNIQDDSSLNQTFENTQDNAHFYFFATWDTTEGFTLSALRALYYDLNEQFNFTTIINVQHLDYVGYFDGDKKFIDSFGDFDLRNQVFYDASGTRQVSTPIRTVMLSRNLHCFFDAYVFVGRNFESIDFYFNAPNEAVNVLLGFYYVDLYSVGDILELSLYGKPIEFKVIGFFEEGTQFASLNRPGEVISFDASIIMPLFCITYEPINEIDYMFQIMHYSQKVTGSVRIEEMPDFILVHSDELHATYSGKVTELAMSHGLRFTVPLLPIPGDPRMR